MKVDQVLVDTDLLSILSATPRSETALIWRAALTGVGVSIAYDLPLCALDRIYRDTPGLTLFPISETDDE